MVYYQILFYACLLLIVAINAALASAHRRKDSREMHTLHLLKNGLCLSAISYFLHILDAAHPGRNGIFSLVFCLVGSVLIGLGWMEHWKIRAERLSAHQSSFAQQTEEDEPVTEALLAQTRLVGSPRCTARVHHVLLRAQHEAFQRQFCCVDTEHLLRGLLHHPRSAGVRILVLSGAHPEKVHQELSGQMALRPKSAQKSLPEAEASLPPKRTEPMPGKASGLRASPVTLTPEAQQVLSLAVQEAQRFGKPSVGTEHLLLGLVLMGKGKAASALLQEGVTVEGIRQEILKAGKSHYP